MLKLRLTAWHTDLPETGSKADGQAHLLVSTQDKICQRSDVNVFLIRFSRDVGDVKAVRFWHDNTGDDPSW